jgi:hypothetical protein
MQRFFIRLTVFVIWISASWGMILYLISDDFNDRFYHKFNYRCGSMITGSSRALLGLNPEVIDPSGQFNAPFLNFAFTQKTSPYGEVYYDAICRKVKKGQEQGLFILEVNPLAIYSFSDSLAESALILGRMHFFNLSPNPEYVLINGEIPAYAFFINRTVPLKGAIAHQSGWNENTASVDTIYRSNKIKEQYDAHDRLFAKARDCNDRLPWLKKTIVLLRSYGRVIVVRMPVASEMAALEQRYYPGFDELMAATAIESGAEYMSFFDDASFEYYDIHHMTSASANRFSAMLHERLGN